MTPNGADTGRVNFEIPRRACPGYLTAFLGDRRGEPGKIGHEEIPPGHRFLLYFHGMADRGSGEYEKRREKQKKNALNRAKAAADWPLLRAQGAQVHEAWIPLKDGTRQALEAAQGMGPTAEAFLEHWNQRADALLRGDAWVHEAELLAPLVTGTGNPHPVENGFAFLAPHGVPYIAGSGIKGVLRRAAEELSLFERDSRWSLSLVWVLFGFDENSGWYRQGRTCTEWRGAYEAWTRENAAHDELLGQWVERVRGQAPKPLCHLSPPEFVAALQQSQTLRRSIHWQGLVSFWDAVPRAGARLGVDILNPHHRTYYLHGGRATPHDAENPTPVYFLTLKPGATFTFRAQLLPGRAEMTRALEMARWKEFLDEAFEKACEELGFGAKGSVGYGHMEIDPSARARWEQAAEDRCRREDLKRHPWREHLPEIERAQDWGRLRQLVELKIGSYLAEPEVGCTIERKARELAAKKWDEERDRQVASWLERSGRTWTHAAGPEKETLPPHVVEAVARVSQLADWDAWKTAGMAMEELPTEALFELEKKFKEWSCSHRKAKKDKVAAWKQLQALLRPRGRG